MLTANFEASCYQIHDAQAVNHEQNIIEKHTTLWQRDGESEAVPNNKRIIRQAKKWICKNMRKKIKIEETTNMSERKGAGTWRGWGEHNTKHSGGLFDFNDAMWDVVRDAVGIVCFYRGPG